MSNRFLPTPCPTVNHSSEIRNLPWVGNPAADSMIYHKIDDYIFRAGISVEERIRALTEMSKYGMGISETVTLQELETYLRVGYDTNRISFDAYLQYLKQIVKWVDLDYPVPVGSIIRLTTWEEGVVVSGGKNESDPIVLSVTSKVAPIGTSWRRSIRIKSHNGMKMKVYTNPQTEKAFA